MTRDGARGGHAAADSSGGEAPPTIRTAGAGDLADLVAFEVEIARASFGTDAVEDPAVHRKRLAQALERDPDSCFVAVDPAGQVVGWAWFAVNTNFLTGQRYVNFRSLAAAPGPDRERVGEALLAHGVAYAQSHGLTELVGRVHAGNVGMRMLYRRAGFEPVSLTMRLRLDETPDQTSGGQR